METALSVLEQHWRDVDISRVVASLPPELGPAVLALLAALLLAERIKADLLLLRLSLAGTDRALRLQLAVMFH